MNKEQIAAFIVNTLEHELREAKRLDVGVGYQHDYDFSAKVRMLVDELTQLTDRYEQLVSVYYQEQSGLYTFTVYREPADTDEPKYRIGTVKADTRSDAIAKAAQLYEMYPHDIVVTQVIEADAPLEFPLPLSYQPAIGDITILKLWVDQFEVRHYNGSEWRVETQYFTNERDVTNVILSGMRYIGSSRNHRHYYRQNPPREGV